jgi:hypothetical protein
MKKSYLMLAAAAALFAACSNDDGVAEAQKAEQQVAASEVPVGFSAYVNRGITRDGNSGVLQTSGGSSPVINLQDVGFGVFGYYCDGKPYSETSIPDFMYNQKVSGAGWTYTPIKYWPNEFGDNAISDNQDRLTFFAYAPWVDVNPSTGRVAAEKEDYGIVGLTTNTATGDPYVKYYVSADPSKSVDLCWGVAATASKPAAIGGNTNAITAEHPYIDVFKPGSSGDDTKINFTFHHALAKLNVQIDATIDEVAPAHANDYPDAEKQLTRIWVRSVTFEGITDKGKLNLNSVYSGSANPEWYEISSANTKIGSGSMTIYDGRRDGKEGFTGDAAKATNETTLGLNSALIQSAAYAYDSEASLYPHTDGLKIDATSTGVPSAKDGAINLFKSDSPEAPIFVIPTNDNFKITIVYDVETADKNLSKYLSDGVVKGSTIENTITQDIKFGSSAAAPIIAGKAYTVKLHLGMTSVKFEATVAEWGSENNSSTDLPINGPVAP